MHVVVCNWKDKYHPEAGGAELYCHSIAREFRHDGDDVTYLTARPRRTAKTINIDDVRVVRAGGQFTVYLWALLWLLRHRRSVDAVVDSQNGIPFFTPLVVRRRTPVLLLIHHVHQEQFGVYFGRVMAAVGRWLEGPASRAVYRRRAVIAVSPSTRAAVRRQLKLRGNIHLATNGVEQGLPSLDHRMPRSAAPRIVCIGRLVTHKRWDRVLAAAKVARDAEPGVQVDIVGDGGDRERLEKLAADEGMGAFVTFHGYTSEAERDALLSHAWLTMSTSAGEGWGLAVVEAAAFGVPALAYDVPGLRDSIRDGITGWLLPDGSDLGDVLVQRLADLRDPMTAATFADACRSWAAQHTWSASAQRIQIAIEQERCRLRLPEGREASNDIATIVELDPDVARVVNVQRLRRTDLVNFCPRCRAKMVDRPTMLLSGTDEMGALVALSRSGAGTRFAGLTLRVATPRDQLSWTEHSLIHHQTSKPRILDGCPVIDVGAGQWEAPLPHNV